MENTLKESILIRSERSSHRSHWAKAELQTRYRETRAFSQALCNPLQVEDYVIQSMEDASPAKWHLAHTSWFFERFVLQRSLPGYTPSDPTTAYLFNSYYNAVGPMHCRARRGMISRPTVEETFRYRLQIDAAMSDLFDHATEEQWIEIEQMVVLGINHEQQHQELLLTDLKHLLSQNPLYPAYVNAKGIAAERKPRDEIQKHDDGSKSLRWLTFPEGTYSIGYEGEGFTFDNEGPRHRVFLESFQLASRLVTNAEYLSFMEDGGYERPELWLSLGWFAVSEQKWRAPLYWEKRDGEWLMFTLAGLCKLNPSEPVCHVSYFEADAYSRWAGARLSTEAEWEVSSADLPLVGNFVENQHFHPIPLEKAQHSSLAQMFGDVWEWTQSSYSPYPRYKAAEGAIGEYNGKFMCNQYVLRGGSCATPRNHIRTTYRNFFAPDKRWQFMGIRLAKDTK